MKVRSRLGWLARINHRLAHVPWRRLAQFDWWLLATVLVTLAVGLAMIYSATKRIPSTGAWDDLVVKQLVFAGLGLTAMILVTLTDLKVATTFWPWLYGLSVVVLAGVRLFGQESFGAQRWLSFGLLDLQPSEFTKVVLILTLAAYFTHNNVRHWRHVLVSLGLTLLMMALVLIQPNLSTTILLGGIWLAMAIAAGIRPLQLGTLAILAGPALYFGLKLHLIKDYQLDRVRALVDPYGVAPDLGYQTIQTKIAVGNGQLWGTGFAHGQQSQGAWLPLVHTDNIFALTAEETGFIGGALLLVLISLLCWRVLRAASHVPDRTSSLVVVGVFAYLFFQTLINVGAVVQLTPVTGVSLPFVSYGGSSLLALFIAIGLVQSGLSRRKSLSFG